MSVKKARKIKDILFPLGVFFCFMGYIFAPLMYVGAAMAAAGLVVYIVNALSAAGIPEEIPGITVSTVAESLNE